MKALAKSNQYCTILPQQVETIERSKWLEAYSTTLEHNEKVNQPISELATTNTRPIQRVLNRNNVDISHQTIETKFTVPISKPLLTEKRRWLDPYCSWYDWNRIIFFHETNVRLNQLKRCVCNLPAKRKVFRTVKGEHLGMFFMQRLWPHLLFPWKSRICKRYLLPTARDHWTNWALGEDNDPKHTSQLEIEVWSPTNRLAINVTRLQSHRKRLEASENEFGKEKS